MRLVPAWERPVGSNKEEQAFVIGWQNTHMINILNCTLYIFILEKNKQNISLIPI